GMLLNDYAENQDLSSFHNGLRKYFLAVGMFRAVVASFLLQQDAGSQSIHEACRRLLIWIEKLIKPKAAEAFDASEVLEDLETVESMFRHDNLRGQFDLLLLDPCMVDRIRYAPEIVGAMKMVDGRYGAGSYNQIVSTIWREHDVPESVLVAFMMRSIDNSKRKRPISRNDWTHLTLKPAADRYIYWVHCIDRALESLKQEEVLKLRPRLVACLKETTRSGNLNGLVPNRTIAKWIHDAAES
ncbi:MAG: hypothetical protein Q7R40_17895, partial [Phaeospirillum sp.]|nr:hypothetical protein [Phaeospirillum sp.]